MSMAIAFQFEEVKIPFLNTPYVKLKTAITSRHAFGSRLRLTTGARNDRMGRVAIASSGARNDRLGWAAIASSAERHCLLAMTGWEEQ